MDALREQLEEESDSKTDLQRQLSRANAEANQWRVKFESEGVSRSEELEEIRRKLSAKLQECESNLESAASKISGLEKNRSRLQVGCRNKLLSFLDLCCIPNQYFTHTMFSY